MNHCLKVLTHRCEYTCKEVLVRRVERKNLFYFLRLFSAKAATSAAAPAAV